jgi:SAM-dependent methyltransferase
LKASRRQGGLFDALPAYSPTDTRAPPESSQAAQDTATSALETTPVRVGFAIGERAKSRDVLAAIRTLKALEKEQRPATPNEKQVLARFCGFGPIALSIFPDPVTGEYKSTGWQALGEELIALLTPAEYDSAKRTTFNAFYSSPTVISIIHDAIVRLGLPANATILEPGCGTGNFMSYGQPGTRFIGIEMDSISGRIAKALHPGQDIRVENFRDTQLPDDRIDAVVGNVPFADLKLDYRGQKLSLHDFFFAKSIDALKPKGVMALVTMMPSH